MLFLDPSAHTRLRSLVNKAFTPRVVEEMRVRIQALTDEALDKIQETDEFDIIGELAHPLPVTVIAEMLGVPPEDRVQFKKWSDDFAAFIGGAGFSPETIQNTTRSLHELTEYLRSILKQLRQKPNNSLIAAMALVEDAGRRLSEEELSTNCLLLLAAGHETTTNLIGNGVLALLQNPAQLQKLRANPELLTGAIEEFLRYDSPVQWTSRLVTEDFEWSGQPLKRLEGQIVFDSLLRRWPTLQLSEGELEWQALMSCRGLKALLVNTLT